ncbi:tyrosyl-tRNA synthetase [Pleosporales sp. CAS-2024a]
MSLLRHVTRPRPRHSVCRLRIGRQYRAARVNLEKAWGDAVSDADARDAAWSEQADRITTGAQQSMLSVLEERGLVKDVAGGRDALEQLLTRKPIGAYVGVDPTAPSLHVGHLVPLMALFWLYIHGYCAVSLLGGGTVRIGDPSGRTTARSRSVDSATVANSHRIKAQIGRLWIGVQHQGIKHGYPPDLSRKRMPLNNAAWLQSLSAVDLMRNIGSGFRLGSMLARDSSVLVVKIRMESGEGMAMSEFSYPLFQSYDWWYMYRNYGVQLQIGGSDQYGNICAGMDAVSHMRRLQTFHHTDNPEWATYGLTTPLLTTASGEKFGKSAGNAVWLDPEMLSSFHLYQVEAYIYARQSDKWTDEATQYFLGTADNDVERYLKLFTFIPTPQIDLVMGHTQRDPSKRAAQHLLAKEVVELVHGPLAASKAEQAHVDAFSQGTNTFSLSALRRSLHGVREATSDQTCGIAPPPPPHSPAAAAADANANATQTPLDTPPTDIITLPLSFLQQASFPRILFAAHLASSVSDARRLIAAKGAYVVVPNSGTTAAPTALQWVPIESTPDAGGDPRLFLVDWDALVLRVGKSRIQICHVVTDDEFEKRGLTFRGWELWKKERGGENESC